MAGAKYRDEREFTRQAGPPVDWVEAYATAKRVLRGEVVRHDTGNVARTAFGFSATTIHMARALVTMFENMSWTKEELLTKLGPPEDRPRKAHPGDLGIIMTAWGYAEAPDLDRGQPVHPLARGHRKPFRQQRLVGNKLTGFDE